MSVRCTRSVWPASGPPITPAAASGLRSLSTRWAARSRVCQPSHKVGAPGPVSSRRLHRAMRSSRAKLIPRWYALALVPADHRSARGHGPPAFIRSGHENRMEPAMSQAGRPSPLDPQIAARLKRDPAGLVAAIAQQYDTGEVLMLGWMDDEALHRTLTTGRCTYWSRSRQEYWVKGETSGHGQRVVSAALDCDGDAVLVKVDQAGGACHSGDRTCFDAGVLTPEGP